MKKKTFVYGTLYTYGIYVLLVVLVVVLSILEPSFSACPTC